MLNNIIDGLDFIRLWAVQDEHRAIEGRQRKTDRAQHEEKWRLKDDERLAELKGLMAGVLPNSEAHLHLAMAKGVVIAVRLLFQLGWTDFVAPSSGWTVHEKSRAFEPYYSNKEYSEDALGCEYNDDAKGRCYGLWTRSEIYTVSNTSGVPEPDDDGTFGGALIPSEVSYCRARLDRFLPQCCCCSQGYWRILPISWTLIRPTQLASALVPDGTELSRALPEIIAAQKDAELAACLQELLNQYNADNIDKISIKLWHNDRWIQMRVNPAMPVWLLLWHAAQLAGEHVDGYGIKILGTSCIVLALDRSLDQSSIQEDSSLELVAQELGSLERIREMSKKSSTSNLSTSSHSEIE